MKIFSIFLTIILAVGMFNCSSIVKTIYLKPELPYIPAKPDYYRVTFHEMERGYCLNEDNAKNLLKNRILDLGYMEELRKILEGLRPE